MEKFQFLVFDKLHFEDYKLVDTNYDDLMKDIGNEIGNRNGCSTNTSSWMNRFPCLKNGDKEYIIVPYNIPSYNDIIKATLGKYAILLLENKTFMNFEEDDIKYFQDNFIYEFDIEKRKQREKEREEQYTKAMIRDSFRLPLLLVSDDTVDIIRFLILNHKQEIFNDMVVSGIADDTDSLSKIFDQIIKESDLKNITISAEKFAFETTIFFDPETQFEPMGLDLRASTALYFSLCAEKSWLKDMFLGISEKEVRDRFSEFLNNADKL